MLMRNLRTAVATAALGVVGVLAPIAVSPAAAADIDYSLSASAPSTTRVGDVVNLAFSPSTGGEYVPYEVTFDVPAGLEVSNTFQSSGFDWTCLVEDRTVTCPGSYIFSRRVQLLAVAPGTYDLTLTIVGTEGNTDPVPDPTPNTASVTTTVVTSTKDMTVGQAANTSGTVGVPTNVVAVAYDNPRPAGEPEWYVDGTLTFDIPDELLPVSAGFDPTPDPPQNDVDGPFFDQGSCAIDGQEVTCSGLTMPGSYEYFSVGVLPLEAGTFPVTATFTHGPNQIDPTPDPRTNTATWNAVIEPGQNGAIGGQVSDGIDGVDDVEVTAYLVGSPTVAATATTDATGGYTLGALAPGQYELRFEAPTGSPFAPQWHRTDGVASTRSNASPVTVTAVGGTVAVPMTLEDLDLSRADLGAGIRSLENTDQMLYAGVEGEIVLLPRSRSRRVDGVTNAYPATTTYAVTVPDGVTITSAFPRWGAGGPIPGSSCTTTAQTVECTLAGGVPQIVVDVIADEAVAFDLVASHTSTTPETIPQVLPDTDTFSIDVSANTGSLSGTLRVAGTNAPVQDALVLAYLPTDGFFPSSANAWTATDTDGTFAFDDLPAGAYKIAVAPAPASGVFSRWLTDATSRTAATTYDVGPLHNGLTGPHALPSRTLVSGTITGPSGPLADTRVVAYAATDRYAGSYETRTAGDGTYTLAGLPAGTYKLRIVAPTGSGLANEWYDNSTNRTTATPLAADGTPLTGIDVTLTP